MKPYLSCFSLLAVLVLPACDPGEPSGSADLVVTGKAAALSPTEYNSLSPEDQYKVTSKLLGTVFKGVPADEFFDLSSSDLTELVPQNTHMLQDTRTALRTDLGLTQRLAIDAAIDGIDAEGNPDPDMAKYRFDSERPRQIPLARIKEYPISRDMYVNWMAYFLTNTIMFSPATEMESSFTIDAQRVYRFLVSRIGNGDSIRSIIRSNLASLHRWRVSRSPENHALEAYELYLGLFDTEQDSYRGGIACKDYYLTDEGKDYLIDVTDFPNTEPQLILDTHYVTTCEDFYDVIAGHPAVIPRVTEVIINYLMSGRSQADRQAMITSIAGSNPETFEDIFTAILFSREYLLGTERAMSFEENTLGILDRLHWTPVANAGPIDENIFRNMSRPDSSSSIALRPMGWDSMSLKIGRLPDVPLDGLSFANYHKAIRESVLRNSSAYSGVSSRPSGLIYDDVGEVRPMVSAMTLENYIDYIFITALQRKASTVERDDLVTLLVDVKNYTFTDSDTSLEVLFDSRYDDAARTILDYISRLPEFYFFKQVQVATGVNT